MSLKHQSPRYIKILSLLNALYPIPIDIRDIARASTLSQEKVIVYLTNLLEDGLITREKEEGGLYQYVITPHGRQAYRQWIMQQRVKRMGEMVE